MKFLYIKAILFISFIGKIGWCYAMGTTGESPLANIVTAENKHYYYLANIISSEHPTFEGNPGSTEVCSGYLIAPKLVLTASHCLQIGTQFLNNSGVIFYKTQYPIKIYGTHAYPMEYTYEQLLYKDGRENIDHMVDRIPVIHRFIYNNEQYKDSLSLDVAVLVLESAPSYVRIHGYDPAKYEFKTAMKYMIDERAPYEFPTCLYENYVCPTRIANIYLYGRGYERAKADPETLNQRVGYYENNYGNGFTLAAVYPKLDKVPLWMPYSCDNGDSGGPAMQDDRYIFGVTSQTEKMKVNGIKKNVAILQGFDSNIISWLNQMIETYGN